MEKDNFEFSKKHSLRYVEMAFRTDRLDIMQNPDGYGKNTGQCGDTVEIFLTVEANRIQHVSFITQGCMNTRACANAVAELVEGKTIQEAWRVTPGKVIRYLETLPRESEHCAELAVGAMYLALADCRELNQKSWKRLYRKK